jgi:peptide/nickel transport system substrate-binding protein
MGGPKQRALLAVLLVRAGEVVSRAVLLDALWGEVPPSSAEESLDTYVYRLRTLVGHDRILREGGGYRLVLNRGEVDADEFEQLVEDARRATDAGDHDAAVVALTEGLHLWRGQAWGDGLDDALIAADARRLDELRLSALETRLEARLALGEGGELVAELEQLVTEHPLRERLLAALMLALYRAGCHTEALEAFQAARRRLVEELGLEPGPELYELQRRILEHDPNLAPPRRFPTSTGSRRSTAVVAALVLVCMAAAGVLLSVDASASRPRLAAGASGVIAIDTGSDQPVAAAPLAGPPGSLTAAAGSVWVADPGSNAILAVDRASGNVVDRIPVRDEPGSIASGDGAIWVASTVGSTVTRVDPATDSVTQRISLPGDNTAALLFTAGRLWVADPVEHELFEIDPASDTLERTVALDLQPSAMAARDGSIWIAGYLNASVEQMDPSSGRVTGRVHVGGGPVALAFTGDSLWVANSLDSTVSRVDTKRLAVEATIPVGSGPTALAAVSGAVWVASQYSSTVSRLDPQRDRVVSTLRVAGAPAALTPAGHRLWVGVAADSGDHRGGTLVIAAPGPLTSSKPSIQTPDPAFYSSASVAQFMGLAYDSLVTYAQTTGSGGLRLVPDLAVSIPTPSDDDRVYAFRIRPGIRYSDGRRLRAGDFRRGVERLFRDQSQGSFLYDALIGARACTHDPRACNLSRGIVTDDQTGTVTFHFSTPDPEFLFDLTSSAYSAPIPAGTPDHETGSQTVSGTGPYRIASVTPTEIRFVRNAYFREWSHAAQPAGNPDAIEWKSVRDIQAGVGAIQRGEADWLFGDPPYSDYHELELRSPAELHVNPQWSVSFVAINTHVAPFTDIRVRRALNYAINRATIVREYGGPSFAVPTCQTIVPGIPGYRRYCPYTLRPGTDGVWGAPDLTRARRLVAQSGTAGERIDLIGSRGSFVPQSTQRYIAGVLRTLGYRVRLQWIPISSITQRMWDHFQINADGNWIPSYPDPSSYVPSFFACNGPNGNDYYCNPHVDREMYDAELLEVNDPARASALWQRVDRQLTDGAEWVSTVDDREVEITSWRVRNYEYNPVEGFLADQAWIR